MRSAARVAAAAICLLCPIAQAQEGRLSVAFETSSAGGRYSPNHVLAVWIETTSGDFVRTLSVTSASRYSRYLHAWNDSSAGTEVDAVTTATLRSYDERSAEWDLRDESGSLVPPGGYLLRIELCDSNADSANDNNQAEIAFDVGSENFTSSSTEGGFSNIALLFSAPTVAPPPDEAVADAAVPSMDADVAAVDASLDDASSTPSQPELEPQPMGNDGQAWKSRSDAGLRSEMEQSADDLLYSDPMCALSRSKVHTTGFFTSLVACVAMLVMRRTRRN